MKPQNVPDYATHTDNPDGSTSWRWEDEDGFNNLTVNCPPTPLIYFDPRKSVPIPAICDVTNG